MNEQNETIEPTDDELAKLPAERLAQMLREKRQSEGKYRTQLREVEAEREKLSQVVSGYQRARFDEFAKSKRVLGSAVDDVAEKVNVSELLGEDGRLDEEKAGEALDSLRKDKPHFFEAMPPKSSIDFTGSPAEPLTDKASWSDVLGG